LTATFVVLAIAEFSLKPSFAKAGGVLGIITALIAYYCAVSELLAKDEGLFSLPLGNIS